MVFKSKTNFQLGADRQNITFANITQSFAMTSVYNHQLSTQLSCILFTCEILKSESLSFVTELVVKYITTIEFLNQHLPSLVNFTKLLRKTSERYTISEFSFYMATGEESKYCKSIFRWKDGAIKSDVKFGLRLGKCVRSESEKFT